MKIAILCLPHYGHLKQHIVDELGSLPHEIFVVEQARTGPGLAGGLEGINFPSNVRPFLVGQIDDELLSAWIRREGVSRVVSFSDRAVVAAARLRERFGMGGNSVQVESRIVDKASTRAWLCEGGLSTLGYKVSSLDSLLVDAASFPRPLIAKPVGLGASICVELLRTEKCLRSYVRRCRTNAVFGAQEVLLEQYIPGPELSVEGMVVGGDVVFFGVTESHTSGEPYFVGTGHDFYAEHPNSDAVYGYVRRIISRLEIDDCPFHIELKCMEHGGFEVIEAHTRYGGAMIMDLVQKSTGIRGFASHLRALVGEPVAPVEPTSRILCEELLCARPGRLGCVGFSDDICSDERVLAWSVDVARGDFVCGDVLPLNYVGFVTYSAENRAEAGAFRAALQESFCVEYL